MSFNGLPRTGPMPSLNALANWSPPDDPFNQAPLAPLQERPVSPGPRLFLYHDMYGGYIPDGDLFPQGTASDNFYNFNFWQYTDIFSYFTHFWLSVPPPAWTNAAHRNGVPILGNLTPPYDDDGSFIQPMLDRPDFYADQLVAICSYYGFDGWAINFETNLLEPRRDNATMLAAFLRTLTQKIHSAIPGSKVIWYDAVTADGRMEWQGQLNEKNQIFFDACDGIFLDYRWKSCDPDLTISAGNAGTRKLDVYAGVNVFEDEWDTWRRLDTAKEAGVSGGLFAFSWTYQQQTDADPFPQREQKLWIGNPPKYPNLESCIGAVIPARPIPNELPFLSNFNVGAGRQFFVDGQRASSIGRDLVNVHWGNMSWQDPLPTWRYQIDGWSRAFTAQTSFDNAWDGPSSLLIRGVSTGGRDFSVFDLFLTSITVPNPCTLGFSYCATDSAPLPDMWLSVYCNNDQTAVTFRVTVTGAPLGWQNVTFDLSSLAGQVISKLQLQVAIPSGHSSVAVHVGELKLLNAGPQPFYPQPVTNLTVKDLTFTTNSLGMPLGSFNLTWDLNLADNLHSYSLWYVWPDVRDGCLYRFIGRAFTNAFAMENVMFDSPTITIAAQPRNRSGYSLPQEQMTRVTIPRPPAILDDRARQGFAVAVGRR
jgi:endo-beta-N-acetylglucosaminidase D